MLRVWGLSAFALTLSLPAARADDQADLKAQLEKSIKAHGGAEALNKFGAGASKMQGKYYGMGEGIAFDGTVHAQGDDRFRMELQMDVMGQKITFLQVYNAGKGWVAINGMTREMNKEELEAMREQRRNERLSRLTPLLAQGVKLSPLGEAKVDGKPVIAIRAEQQGFRDVSLFFDKTTGLLLKTETRGRDPAMGDNEFTAETFFSDYRKVEGVMMAHKIKLLRDGKLFVEGETTDVKLAEKLDDNLFVKP
jgi:hypothetical protein